MPALVTDDHNYNFGKKIKALRAFFPISRNVLMVFCVKSIISFNRTQALSQAVRPLQREGQGAECAQELGIRKTRHNSTLESICTLQT